MRSNLIKARPTPKMTPLLHALNIGTLATWLSFAGFGTVALTVSGGHRGIVVAPENAYDRLETIELSESFMTGDADPGQQTESGDAGESTDEEVPPAPEEILPTPPEMPELTQTAPLPEVPNIPEPEPKPKDAVAAAPAPPPRQRTTDNRPAIRTKMKVSATGGSPKNSTESRGKAGNGRQNGGSGSSDMNRLAGGRMQAPSYPAEARAKGQTGTVVVEFIVGENGRVISAYAKRPSPWPLLNDRAVSAVQRWKFRSGAVAKFTRPITFKLN